LAVHSVMHHFFLLFLGAKTFWKEHLFYVGKTGRIFDKAKQRRGLTT